MQRLLAADAAGGAYLKAHEYSCYALAGATPVAFLASKGSTWERLCDWTFALAIPVHTHYSMNAVINDYLPKSAKGPARAVILGASIITYLGVMKVNLAGPGVTQTVKALWKKDK